MTMIHGACSSLPQGAHRHYDRATHLERRGVQRQPAFSLAGADPVFYGVLFAFLQSRY